VQNKNHDMYWFHRTTHWPKRVSYSVLNILQLRTHYTVNGNIAITSCQCYRTMYNLTL